MSLFQLEVETINELQDNKRKKFQCLMILNAMKEVSKLACLHKCFSPMSSLVCYSIKLKLFVLCLQAKILDENFWPPALNVANQYRINLERSRREF